MIEEMRLDNEARKVIFDTLYRNAPYNQGLIADGILDGLEKLGYALFKGDSEGLLTPETIMSLCEKWGEEYEISDMTDAEWEMKRFSLLIEAQQLLDQVKLEEAVKAERERLLNQLQGIYNQATDLGELERELREFLESFKGEAK